MRKISAILALTFCCTILSAQNRDVLREVREDRSKACGLDNLVNFDVEKLTPAPKGYKAFYISHYGRHGSRYAYTEKTYSTLKGLLQKGSETNNLTAYGKALYDSISVFSKRVHYKTGDLTPKGWEQHRRIAEIMVREFPDVFKKGARVDAVSSKTQRAIVSMASFCASLSRQKPELDVYAHQGFLEQQTTAPNSGENPLRYTGRKIEPPYNESYEEFFTRKMPGWKQIYERIFVNPDLALEGMSPVMTTLYVYMLAAGMESLPEDVRMDLYGIFTDDEFAAYWEVDNFMRFNEYHKYKVSCCSILDDIVAKADARIKDGEKGADLRFGHDHVLMTLFMLLDIDGFATIPESSDELAWWFQSYRSPMAGNIQMVFYQPTGKSRGRDILVKLLLNGEECHLSGVNSDSFPYYRWNDVREYLLSQVRFYTKKESADPTDS